MDHQTSDTLTLRNVHKVYEQGGKPLVVLKGITASFNQGALYAITGVSGSGKSTLLHLLGGLDEPSEGDVWLNDKNLQSLRSGQKSTFLNRTVGFVFQFHYLVKELTVAENIMMIGLIRGERQSQCRERVAELLAMVGLTDKATVYPTKLSGGEQQRVAIARALFNRPSFLLADEPTGNLDADNAQRVVDICIAAQQEWGMGIVLCSHDSVIYNRMTSVYRLRDGVLTLEKD